MTLLSLFRTKPRKHEHAERSVLAPVATAAFLGGGLLVAGLYRNYKTRKLITTLRDLRADEAAKRSAMRGARQSDINEVLRVFPAFVTLLEDEQLVAAVCAVPCAGFLSDTQRKWLAGSVLNERTLTVVSRSKKNKVEYGELRRRVEKDILGSG